jgi:ribulose-phosphate 3-epimerase
MRPFFIAPSILSADFARLGEETEKVLAAGADRIHIDVMDNHYVPNLTLGPLVCESLRNFGITAPLDVHLMTMPVDSLVSTFAKAGATSITFHPEATLHVHRTLELIHTHQCQAGIALNPATPLNYLDDILQDIDMVLIMSVNPGFGGQTFITHSLEKIKRTQKLLTSCKRLIPITVDGGIHRNNIMQIANAGGSMFVVGSAIFKSKDYAKTIHELKEAYSGFQNL